MEEAGPSITVTSATNILSFGIGVLTPTPAISIFCLYTAVGVAIDFIYQVSLPPLSIHSEKEKWRNDCLTGWKEGRVLITHFFLPFIPPPPLSPLLPSPPSFPFHSYPDRD